MSTEQRTDRPTPVPESDLSAIAKLLPKGAHILLSVKLAYPTAQGGASDAPSNCTTGPCVLVIYDQDDHTIHRAEMCGSGTSYEICSDTTIGTW
jgi:hypothetical protein